MKNHTGNHDVKVDTVKAQAHEKQAITSWERSGVDGFLSQWGHGIQGQLASKQAEIIENGGTYRLLALYQYARVVAARLVDGPYGLYWAVETDQQAKGLNGHYSIPFDNSHEEGGKRSTAQKKLGLSQRWAYLPAKAIIVSSGTGLSGTTTAQVVVVRE